MNSLHVRQYLAELVGTFVLVFGGVGSAILAGQRIGFTGIALAFGLSLLAMVYTIGPISGCHVNPAVTLGVFITKKISARGALGYVAGQVIGAVLATAAILAIAKGAEGGYDTSLAGLGANGYGLHSPGHYGLAACFLAEVLLTMLLVLTVLGSTHISAPVGFAGIAIGLVLTGIHLVGIPITNTSVNPVRSLGPALFVGGWALQQLWLFIVAPLVGALVASGVYIGIRLPAVVLPIPLAHQSLESQQVDREKAIS